jgi:hypothetical protein
VVYFDNFWEKFRWLILILVKKAEKRKADDEPTDPETPRNKDLKYDRKKRTRTFQNSWIDKFPWVKACEGPAAAWGSSSSLNQCLTHNKCSWCLWCNLSPSMRKFLVPRVRASFLSDKCGNFLQYLQYISWAYSSKTTQGNLSIHEFWNVLVRFFLSYLLDLGENYRNINGCKTFAASIAQTLVDQQVKFHPTNWDLANHWPDLARLGLKNLKSFGLGPLQYQIFRNVRWQHDGQ